MKEITVVEPVFVADFHCVGSECRDHCCKGWDITLDKKTVNRYLKSSQIEIRNIASENILTTKKSQGEWGMIKLSAGSNCAFMDTDMLCKVHKQLGEKALSTTCSTYPRKKRIYQSAVDNSVMLSCPEAAKKLLTRPDAMMFTQSTFLQAKANHHSPRNQDHRLINLMAMNLVKRSSDGGPAGLYGIALLLMRLDKMKLSGSVSVEELEDYYLNIISNIDNGVISSNIGELNSNHELQWALLLRMQTYFVTQAHSRSARTFDHYMSKLLYIQGEGAQNGDVAASMKRLDKVWQEKALPWLAERPHLMSNYLQYKIYNDNFPGNKNRTPLASLYLLTAEWFMVKSLIAACIELVGEVEENDVINIIYSFQALTTHNASCSTAFFNEIDKVKVNDDLSLIYLLK
ncbi:flagellin lysine-N-methylase [Erwinia persicina]|uniref:flagellin lysine-N-methylase n=1 Tax=Erwinia persicina TaxID=55211 RepID=UPI001781FD5F|nr:flagellin lysine-N-methylase [Erwinia persicina]MBD8164610.1 flagellin lysine-N-methylase [Erwinia persicina]